MTQTSDKDIKEGYEKGRQQGVIDAIEFLRNGTKMSVILYSTYETNKAAAAWLEEHLLGIK